MGNTILKLLNQHYFTLINLVLITTLVGAGTGSGYKILTGVMTQKVVAPAEKKKSRATARKRIPKTSVSVYDSVAERNLFNILTRKDLEKKDEVIPEKVIEITDLNLKLWGTIVAGEKFSRAIIEDTKKRKQELFKIGDTVQAAIVKRIERNRVILSVNGKEEALEVEKGKTKSSGRGRGRSEASRKDHGSSVSSRDIAVKRSLIDESMKNLNELMKDVRIRPHFKNGKSDGLIVSGIKSGSVFRKLGLRNGDIIMGVDGKQIESVDDAMQLYSGLKDLENMKVDIKRRGRLQTLNFNIE